MKHFFRSSSANIGSLRFLSLAGPEALAEAPASPVDTVQQYFNNPNRKIPFLRIKDRYEIRENKDARKALIALQEHFASQGIADKAAAALNGQEEGPNGKTLRQTLEATGLFGKTLRTFDAAKTIDGTPDGKFGHGTRLMVAYTQWKAGLEHVEGSVGPDTAKTLEKAAVVDKAEEDKKKLDKEVPKDPKEDQEEKQKDGVDTKKVEELTRSLAEAKAESAKKDVEIAKLQKENAVLKKQSTEKVAPTEELEATQKELGRARETNKDQARMIKDLQKTIEALKDKLGQEDGWDEEAVNKAKGAKIPTKTK